MMTERAEMSFLQHLEVLRWHLIRGFVAIGILSVLAFVFPGILFDEIILAPARPDFWTNEMLCHLAEKIHVPTLCINQIPLVVKNIDMSGQFTIHLWVAFLAGVIVGFPYFFWEIWRFIKPALYEKETYYTRGAILVVSILFFIGVLFGYYVIAPMSVQFLGTYQVSETIPNEVTLTSYISTVSSIVLASGVMFELPVFIYILVKIGLLSASFLQKYRRHAIVVVVVIAAIITPPDVISQIFVSIPMLFLYEFSIIVARQQEKKRERTKI